MRLSPIRALIAVIVAALIAVAPAMAQQASAPARQVAPTVAASEVIDDADALNDEILRLYGAGKYGEALPLAERVLALREKSGPEHIDVAQALNNLSEIHRAIGHYGECERLYRRALAILTKAHGVDHPDTATTMNNIAGLLKDQGRYAEAEPLMTQSLAIREKLLAPEDPALARAVNNLAGLFERQGRYREAEALYKRSLALREKGRGPDHLEVATALQNLAGFIQDQGRPAEAELLLRRSLVIREKALQPGHPLIATSLGNLAELYRTQGRFAEAEPLLKRGLAILEEALGPDHPQVAKDLNNLGLIYHLQQRYAEAERLYRRSLAIDLKALGAEHPGLAPSLKNLGNVFREQGRSEEARSNFTRALALEEKALGPDHPSVAATLHDLASLALADRDFAKAADLWWSATSVLRRHSERGLGARTSSNPLGSLYSQGFVKATYRLIDTSSNGSANRASGSFEVAQWGASSAAAKSLAQMAARAAGGSPQLATLVRARQDLVAEWQTKDEQLIAAKSEPPEQRHAASEQLLAERLAAIDAHLAAIDSRFATDFPDYAALSSPKPMPIAEVQTYLQPGEALVLFLDTHDRFEPLPEETFIWVVTRTGARWVRSDLGPSALRDGVDALRCGLDFEGTWGSPSADRRKRCADLLAVRYAQADHEGGKPLPFSVGIANEMFEALFGQVADMIAGKQLLIVPSGPLTQLPFQVLVTSPPETAATSADAMRKARWLVRDHAITVLPSVASLRSLRQNARTSRAGRVMIGFGNPLLDGGPDDAELANRARLNTSCPVKIASVSSFNRGLRQVEAGDPARVAAQLRLAQPLPETADELCAVASEFRVGPDAVYLGQRATVSEVERLSSSGELANYRMIHFATHGALAGQITGSTEPGLVMTPPKAPSALDDGYLSASRIAGLKLDADWAILSACNTAAGEARGAEALSGLARAFFYAGVRALLVSHWSVDSEATVKLITGALRRLAIDPALGRAEAIRRSMLALIDDDRPREAHPAFWAPFAVVGEGGIAR